MNRAIAPASSRPPLVIHVIHQLAVGGLENGLINVINRMDPDRFRHGIVCMTQSSDFQQRLRRQDVAIHCMRRDEISQYRLYRELYRLFRRLQPCIVHSRNRSGLDALLPAKCAGVPVRIHGEHGRDIDDLDGSNPRYRRLKRLLRPLVTHYTAVSLDLAHYLRVAIGVPTGKIRHIYNGVDTEAFRPRDPGARDEQRNGAFTVGTVGRLQPVKDQVCLVKAFGCALEKAPDAMQNANLLIVGEGPMRALLEKAIAEAGLHGRVHLAGASHQVSEILRVMDLFVLPSLAEGVSNTLLEAMASGLPVVATRVGGNVELVQDNSTGVLVDPGDWEMLAERIAAYARAPELRLRHGFLARQRAEREFGLDVMVSKYQQLYEELAGTRSQAAPSGPLASLS